ncbi:GuaB1 family IMP dehydrogenase-related protein [Boudabousia marimammalium]|uniref:GMP reductase n=1 Tax=Boudabousia marimammalium TaxID=156892 RepID=A0A1Q5PQL5_9ACTO|nr:GuaB1 family IMP dehydrogenase-related protein [Boudabousia marimammalium]OKL49911.1 inosine 5-monophosphate dehydrogenase [Boudabousia marimammalium]
MRFLNDITPPYELTYDDIFMVPSLSEIPSRFDVNLSSDDGTGTTMPIVVANMTAVAGKRMAETVARRGGLVCISQDIPADYVARTVGKVKAASTVYDTPVKVDKSCTVTAALSLIHKRSHRAVIVVDAENHPIGVVPESSLHNVDHFAQLHTIMDPNPLTLPEGISPDEAYAELTKERLGVAAIVDKENHLVGVLTSKGCVRSTIYQPNVDSAGKLRIAAAVGINGDVAGRAEQLVAAGVDVLVVDTAHGHQRKMVDALQAIKASGITVPIVAGNIVTADAVDDLVSAGADILKVGIGPGAMCTTRMATAVGRPQFSAVLECSQRAHALGKHVWADGGVRHPRDVALALAAGASNVMVGSWFAGTYESPGDIVLDGQGKPYKENYGMASRRAVTNRNAQSDSFDRARKLLFEEGISTSRMYLSPSAPSVEDIIDRILAGVRSSFTYAGSRNQAEFRERAIVGVQSAAGYKEGAPVSQSW